MALLTVRSLKRCQMCAERMGHAYAPTETQLTAWLTPAPRERKVFTPLRRMALPFDFKSAQGPGGDT